MSHIYATRQEPTIDILCQRICLPYLMKLKNKRISASALSVCVLLSFSAVASAQSNYNWNTGTGTWDTSSSNWTGAGAVWANGNNATFSNTAAATTVTLSSGLTANNVVIGGGGNNANYTFTGGSLSAASFTLQASGSNDLSNDPTTTLTGVNLTSSGAITIGRAGLVIDGNSVVSASSINSASGDGLGAWGSLTIAGNADVTATNGFSVSTTAWGLNLNGGTLTTSNLSYAPHSFNGTTNLNFNGTLIKANQNNSNFIVVGPGGIDSGFNPSIQAGGARFDSNGFNIGIGVSLAGTGGLTKSGAGTLTLSGGANTFTGGVTVDGGVLLLSNGQDANTIAAGNAVTVNTGGTLRLGATGQIQDTISSFSINGGTFDLQGHVEGVTTSISLNNGTITGTSVGFLLARGGYVGTGTNTISQRISVRGTDVNSGVFNITSGTTTVSSAIYTDPFGTASGITKRGAGTLTLTGTNSYAGNTTVEAGTLIVNGSIANATTTTVQSGATISGSGSVGSLTVNSGATINPGNSPGTLTVNGTYSQAGTLVAEIAGISSGQYDQLIVNGTVNLTGSLTAQFSGTGYSLNDMVFLLVNDSTDAIGGNGIFTGLAQGATVTTFGGFDWVISYNADSVGNTFTGGNDIALRAIPEPSAALLGGLGVLGLLRRRRRHVA